MFEALLTSLIIIPFVIILSIYGIAGLYLMTIFPIQMVYKLWKDKCDVKSR